SDSPSRIISLLLQRDIDEPVCAGGASGSRCKGQHASRRTAKSHNPCLPIRCSMKMRRNSAVIML
ncbi:hypothetical protein GQ44DRAFT_624894, partial [Phaeosphaeriaceae sp. PMI808]